MGQLLNLLIVEKIFRCLVKAMLGSLQWGRGVVLVQSKERFIVVKGMNANIALAMLR